MKALRKTNEESIDDCVVPLFGKNSVEFDMPVCVLSLCFNQSLMIIRVC